MGQNEYLVFTCRACRRVIKLAPALSGKHIVCPHCRTKISVPKDAPLIEEEGFKSQIPAQRQNDELVSNLRPSEEWEVGRRPVGGEMEFREQLHSTQDPELQPSPDTEMKRVNMRRRRMERTQPDFDQLDRRKKHRRKLRSSGAAVNKLFTRALVVAVAVLLVVVGWLGLDKWRRAKSIGPSKPKMEQIAPTKLEPASDGRPKLETRHFADYGPALAAAARRFAAAKTVEELLPLVRNRERVAPKIAAYYTAERPWRPIEINNKFSPDEPVAVDGDFIVITLMQPNGDVTPVTFERVGETFLADWECFTGYGDLSWEELRVKRPVQPVVLRAIVERSANTDYWNDAFPNHTTHTCYQLRDLSSTHFLSGYVVKNSTVDLELSQCLHPLPPPATLSRGFAILEISYPPDSKDGQQVNILKVLEQGWVFRPDN